MMRFTALFLLVSVCACEAVAPETQSFRMQTTDDRYASGEAVEVTLTNVSDQAPTPSS